MAIGKPTKRKWVIVHTLEHYAVGPFDTMADAQAYRDTDPQSSSNIYIMELKRPSRGWSKRLPAIARDLEAARATIKTVRVTEELPTPWENE